MQQRVPSKSKLTTYTSVKDIHCPKENNKKSSKMMNQKSNQKHKLSKNNTPSLSKIKMPSKSQRNNENVNTINFGN